MTFVTDEIFKKDFIGSDPDHSKLRLCFSRRSDSKAGRGEGGWIDFLEPIFPTFLFATPSSVCLGVFFQRLALVLQLEPGSEWIYVLRLNVARA